MNELESDKEFLEYVVTKLVDNPNDVVVDRTIDEMGVLLTLKVNSQDMGQVIGKEGQTARALRTLLRVIGAKNNARVNLKIYEPEGHRKEHMERQQEAPKHREPSVTDIDDAVADLKL